MLVDVVQFIWIRMEQLYIFVVFNSNFYILELKHVVRVENENSSIVI